MFKKIVALIIPPLLLCISYLLCSELRYVSLFHYADAGLHSLTLFSNAFHPSSLDIIFRALDGIPVREKELSSLFLSILGLGLGVFSAIQAKREILTAVALGLSLVTFFLFFGIDVVASGSICLLPWIVVADRCDLGIIRAILIATLLMVFPILAGIYSFYLLPLCFLLLPHLREDKGYYFIAVIAVGLLYLFIPEWSVPLYPHDAHVVPDDGLPGNVVPLTTMTPPIPLINRVALRLTLGLPVVVLITGFALILFVERKKKDGAVLALAGTVVLLGADILLPEGLSVISPLQTLRRILPLGFGFSPAPVLFAAVIIFSGLLLKQTQAIALSTLLIAFQVYSAGTAAGSLSSHTEDSLAVLALQQPMEVRNRVLSPSFSVIRKYKVEMKLLESSPEPLTFASLKPKQKITLAGTHGSILRKKLIRDQDPSTRLRVGTGGQNGNEWLCIQLPPERRMKGVRLRTGNFSTDFPRGILVKEGNSCEQAKTNPTHTTRYAPWEGSLQFTPSGFPFFGPQADVRIELKGTPNTVYFEQKGISPFDWSVTEVELALNAQKLE